MALCSKLRENKLGRLGPPLRTPVSWLAFFLLWGPITFFAESSHASNSQLAKRSARGLARTRGICHWTDYLVHGEWRIQRQAGVNHFRVLNEHNRPVLSGTWCECLEEIERRRCRGQLAPLPSHVVIVMHGLAGSRRLMQGLADYLSEQGGYTVLNVGYASTRGTVQEQAIALESVLEQLEGVSEVSFVCHSMSNIIVRHMLYRLSRRAHPISIRFRRMVMVSPPNQGAQLADRVFWGLVGRTFLGPPATQLAPERGWPALERQLATPDFEFGILAGGRGNQRGYLVSLPGDDDGLLTIRTHCLAGADDYRQIGGLHQIMPLKTATQHAALCFLKHGHF